jgi:hypothetical protein
MTIEDSIKAEVRMFALESIVCQFAASQFQTMPRAVFDTVQKRALEGAQTHVFPGFDPAYSDVVSSEFEAVLKNLYSMIQHHLDTAQKRQETKNQG